MSHLFHFDIPILNLALRASIVYFSVLILLRISGKRQLGQMGATEFVAVLLISNAVQNAMNGGDNSLIAGLWLAGILIALSTVISFLTYRYRIFREIFEGSPTLMVFKGRFVAGALAKERLSESEFKALLRKQGVHALQELETAILEADGTLSVTKTAEASTHAAARPERP